MGSLRTHTCNELRLADTGKVVRLAGWLHRHRDHGNVVFLDVRDHYGITQCVIESTHKFFAHASRTPLESVVRIKGCVVARSEDTVNSELPTGQVEVKVEEILVESQSQPLPLSVNSDAPFPEDTRLTYRFLDLRRKKMHNNIMLRSQVIAKIRELMHAKGFTEFQTPILTASSPEGARDFVVPSRLHPGKFYALPQAPQQFKQLLMVSGFDRYFQIAPCFRDEDARADRSPGEFYQLDMEMAFVTQEDVLRTVEEVMFSLFMHFAKERTVSESPFPRIPYKKAISLYGTDKPDLRNPLILHDATSIFADSSFSIFANNIQKGAKVIAIPAPEAGHKPRRFFDSLNAWAQSEGAPGLGYIQFVNGVAKGPIAKFLSDAQLNALRTTSSLEPNDAVFFVCHKAPFDLAGKVRQKVADELDIIEKDAFRFCWIVDFPMFEEKEGNIIFSHNPFSMPQGGLEALKTKNPLDILAYQYDIVCNGIELSSGAIRNHLPEVMVEAFSIAGYSKEQVEADFKGMLHALRFGAPPHGGCAPGLDRIVMLLANEMNLREIVAFPMNQQAQDLLMNAPSSLPEAHLKQLHIHINKDVYKNS